MEQSHGTGCFKGEFFRLQRSVIKHNENPLGEQRLPKGVFHLIDSMIVSLVPIS